MMGFLQLNSEEKKKGEKTFFLAGLDYLIVGTASCNASVITRFYKLRHFEKLFT